MPRSEKAYVTFIVKTPLPSQLRVPMEFGFNVGLTSLLNSQLNSTPGTELTEVTTSNFTKAESISGFKYTP